MLLSCRNLLNSHYALQKCGDKNSLNARELFSGKIGRTFSIILSLRANLHFCTSCFC